MPTAYYVTHPEVVVSRDAPVPEWPLSAVGRRRAEDLARKPSLGRVERLIASEERKAVETAEIVGRRLGLPVETRPRMHENDRSATGFLPPEEFERTADAFFARPDESVRGWERAVDAQARILAEVEDCLSAGASGDIAFFGHGGVGTLLFLALAGLPISRAFDQPAGGGAAFAFGLPDRQVRHGWRRVEDL